MLTNSILFGINLSSILTYRIFFAKSFPRASNTPTFQCSFLQFYGYCSIFKAFIQFDFYCTLATLKSSYMVSEKKEIIKN